MNKECINKNIDCFRWWVKGGRSVWIYDERFIGDWHKESEPQWNNLNASYVQDDEYAAFRKALALGKPVYLNINKGAGCEVTAIDKKYQPSAYSLTQASPRWRAEEDEFYWYIDTDGAVELTQDISCDIDNKRYSIGNYFSNSKRARLKAQKVKEVLALREEDDESHERIKVLVICWDGSEYTRETSEQEIEELRQTGEVCYTKNGLVFDFRTSRE